MSSNEPNEALIEREHLCAFLNGERDIGGLWFGDRDASGKAFWWRKHLSAIHETAASPTGSPDEATIARWNEEWRRFFYPAETDFLPGCMCKVDRLELADSLREVLAHYGLFNSAYSTKPATTPPAATTVGEVERLREARELLDFWFAPWGSWKTVRWEDLSGDKSWSADTMLGLVREALLTPTAHTKDQE